MIECNGLKVWYPIRSGILNRVHGHIRAVDDVTLTIHDGETVGLVGESGCGKTTLGRTVAGLEKPTAGEVRYDGQNIAALHGKARHDCRRAIQMIFQDPFSSLDPRMCAMDIITEDIPALNADERKQCACDLLHEVGLTDEVLYRYPHEFSGGQRQRLSIARALAPSPRFVVCDEPVSALDVSVQAQILKLLIALRERHKLSYLFISHDLSVVRLLAQRVAVMYLGHIVEIGPASDVLTAPLHPYTQALVSAIPVPGVDTSHKRIVLQGEVPSPAAPPSGCPFRTRCPHSLPTCAQSLPPLRPITPNASHLTSCHRM